MGQGLGWSGSGGWGWIDLEIGLGWPGDGGGLSWPEDGMGWLGKKLGWGGGDWPGLGLGWEWVGLGLGEGWAWAGLGMGGRALAENTPVHCSTPSTTLKQEIPLQQTQDTSLLPTVPEQSSPEASSLLPRCPDAGLTRGGLPLGLYTQTCLVYLSVPKMFPLLTCLPPPLQMTSSSWPFCHLKLKACLLSLREPTLAGLISLAVDWR